MSKITFTKEQIKLLKENSYVQRISELSITYSDEFKRLFIDEYLKGKNPKAIFIDVGFDVKILGWKRYEQAAAKWIRSYKKDEIIGLRDTRKENSGRPTENKLSKNYIIQKQEAKIQLLEEQLELLKKLAVTERRLVNNNLNLASRETFELINQTIISNNYTNMTSHFCELLNVSRSGYYRYINTGEQRKISKDKDLVARDNILWKPLNIVAIKKVLDL